MTARRERPIQVLVVDDSASNRRTIAQVLESATGIVVCGKAADGEEGLKLAHQLQPDVITLDLEMPRLDGFTFLRLLKAKQPTPVIVISSWAHRKDVFKALELGALDFVAKPAVGAAREAINQVKAELIEKIRQVRAMKPADAPREPPPPKKEEKPKEREVEPEPVVVAVGASTGGPPAVQKLVESLGGTQVCLLVAQHMPPRFTKAFAERLDKTGSLKVSEARDGDRPRAGHVFIAPGGAQLRLVRREGRLLLAVSDPAPDDKHAPSVDRLFESVADTLGERAHAIVLTGMGNDGEAGCRALKAARAEVWAESDETAVISGMPQSAVSTGAVQRVLALNAIAHELKARLKSGR